MADSAIVAVAGRVPERQLQEALCEYAEAGLAGSTRRVYGSSWRGFCSWCASVAREPLPAEAATVALFLTARAREGVAVTTLARDLAAINAAHQAQGFPAPAHPDLDRVWAGIRRTHGRPPRKKRALVVDDLRRVLAKLPDGLSGKRDRALLLVGFAAALRRCELAALSLPGPGATSVHVEFLPAGMEIHIDRGKGDQLGRGAVVAVPNGKKICAVAALQSWLAAAKINSGPVFRSVDRHGRIGEAAISEKAVADVVKRSAERVGLDPALFAGHSLRSGLLTSAADKGAAPDVLQAHARHSKFDTTRGYIQQVDRFKRNAAGKVL